MKKFVKIVSLLLVLCLAFAALAACGNKSEDKAEDSTATGIKADPEKAEKQIKAAFQDWINEAFGDTVTEAKITVEKIYTAEEEEKEEALKSYNLGPDEVAFEVKYELKPAEGVDANTLTAATGEYDAESGWVKEKYNLGILRPSDTAESGYVVTDIGTGW